MKKEEFTFSNVRHAWSIVQRFKALPDDDPALMLDDEMMIHNPLFDAAVTYVIKHRDEDPETKNYFRAISAAFGAMATTCREREDGSFEVIKPQLPFCQDRLLTFSEILSDKNKKQEFTEYIVEKVSKQNKLDEMLELMKDPKKIGSFLVDLVDRVIFLENQIVAIKSNQNE